MYAVGIIENTGNVALVVQGQWVRKVLKNPQDVTPNNITEMGLFHFHSNSDECYWVNPNDIIERAVVSI